MQHFSVGPKVVTRLKNFFFDGRQLLLFLFLLSFRWYGIARLRDTEYRILTHNKKVTDNQITVRYAYRVFTPIGQLGFSSSKGQQTVQAINMLYCGNFMFSNKNSYCKTFIYAKLCSKSSLFYATVQEILREMSARRDTIRIFITH